MGRKAVWEGEGGGGGGEGESDPHMICREEHTHYDVSLSLRYGKIDCC